MAAGPAQPPLQQGRWIEITGAEQPFSAILTPHRGTRAAGAVLLIPDRESHPDRRDATGILRAGLPEVGWTTLAIRLPDSGETAPPETALRRIGAALAYLQQQQLEPIVLIGHGYGATLAAAYLAGQPQTPPTGLVALGWYDPAAAQDRFTAAGALAQFQAPVYDLYGSRGLIATHAQAAARLAAAREASHAYRQQVMAGADHDFAGLDLALVQRVRGWLQTEILRDTPSSPTRKARTP